MLITIGQRTGVIRRIKQKQLAEKTIVLFIFQEAMNYIAIILSTVILSFFQNIKVLISL